MGKYTLRKKNYFCLASQKITLSTTYYNSELKSHKKAPLLCILRSLQQILGVGPALTSIQGWVSGSSPFSSLSLCLLSMVNALLDLVPTSHQHRIVLMKKKTPTYLQLLIHRHKRNPKAILLLLPNLSISKLRISFSCCPTCKLLFPKSTQFYAFQPKQPRWVEVFAYVICLTLVWIEVLSSFKKAISVCRHCTVMVLHAGGQRAPQASPQSCPAVSYSTLVFSGRK